MENSIPRKIKTPTDFTYLSGIIYERCRETISESTLKRIWGYIDGYDTVRFHTLSILARFVGYNESISRRESSQNASSFEKRK